MECNKDEANRAKAIAESKLEQKDYVGAKKFALKAQTLYSALTGISQMLTTLEVYISAENKIGGHVDWYRVLDVSPTADEDTIKKQYRKLALLLHPDKNKSVGAEGAFKLISEASKLLSDKEKRLAYDHRTRCRSFASYTQKVPTHHQAGPSAPCRPHAQKAPAYNGAQPVPPRASQQKAPAPPRPKQKRTAKVPRTANPTAPLQRPDAFWTVCRKCNTYFEYLKIFCNQTLLCPTCKTPYLAVAVAPPLNLSKSARAVPWREWKERNMPQEAGAEQAGPSSFTYAYYSHGPALGTSDTVVRYPNAAETPCHVDLNGSHGESNGAGGMERCFKKVKLDEGSSSSSRYGVNQYRVEGCL